MSSLPTCLNSSELGSLALTVHQDLLDNLKSLINPLSELFANATNGPIATFAPVPSAPATGVLTIPYLAAIQNVAGTTGPGSGLARLLWTKRTNHPPGGGSGLLDALAVWLLQRKVDGSSRLESASASGTLPSTLSGWGINTATTPGSTILADLTANRGKLAALPMTEQVAVVDGFENSEMGVLAIAGIPTATQDGHWTFAGVPLLGAQATKIAGTLSFTPSQSNRLITQLDIGSNGDINLGLTFPNLSLTGMFHCWTTWQGTVAELAIALAVSPELAGLILAFMMEVTNQDTPLTFTTNGVAATFNIKYQFNPGTNCVDPVVTIPSLDNDVTQAVQMATVGFSATWNLPADIIDSFVAFAGNTTGYFVRLFLEQVGKALQDGLIKAQARFPLGPTGFTATAGGAQSTPKSLLAVFADANPVNSGGVYPYATQVNTPVNVVAHLTEAHATMRSTLNPQPASAPLPGNVITVGNYVGVGVSQNALNDYLSMRWANGEFQLAVTDPAIIRALFATIPAQSPFAGQVPPVIRMWPATAPRVEIAVAGIVTGAYPLMVYFDDIRACFGPQPPAPSQTHFNPSQSPSWELSFNAKAQGTVELGWPLFDISLDVNTASPCEERTIEFVDGTDTDVMHRYPVTLWPRLARALTALFLAPHATNNLGTPTSTTAQPPPTSGTGLVDWSRKMPAMQQGVIPGGGDTLANMLYVEILGHHRILYVLQALHQTTLTSLVDASGAPVLNGGQGSSAVTLANMTPAQEGQSIAPLAQLLLQDYIIPR